MKVDIKDLEILYQIMAKNEINIEAVSKEMGIPKSTLHYRLKKLRENKVIKGVYYDVDSEKLGLDITAISLVKAKYSKGYGDRVGKKLADIPGVWAVYFVLGENDFVVLVKAKDRDSLGRIMDQISEIPEVERTSTAFVLKVIKEEKNILKNYRKEDIENYFSD